MGELVEEISQDSEITEVQVPWLVQLPGTADRPRVEFLFRLAEAVSGPVSCPRKLHQPRNLQFSTFVFFRDFLHRFTR